MGLFEEAGRRFERFKRQARDAAREEAEFECEACGTRLYADRDDCPECGGDRIRRVETDRDVADDGAGDRPESDPKN